MHFHRRRHFYSVAARTENLRSEYHATPVRRWTGSSPNIRHFTPHKLPHHEALQQQTDPYFLSMNCQTDSGTKTAKQKTKHAHFTCEAERAPAGIFWGGRGLTHCNASGAVQTAVWFYQAGVPDKLAKLPDPSWGTSALQERGTIFKICSAVWQDIREDLDNVK